jgi:hypothetical protein
MSKDSEYFYPKFLVFTFIPVLHIWVETLIFQLVPYGSLDMLSLLHVRISIRWHSLLKSPFKFRRLYSCILYIGSKKWTYFFGFGTGSHQQDQEHCCKLHLTDFNSKDNKRRLARFSIPSVLTAVKTLAWSSVIYSLSRKWIFFVR